MARPFGSISSARAGLPPLLSVRDSTARTRRYSALDEEALLSEEVAEPGAAVTLELDHAVAGGAAGAEGAFQVGCELCDEFRVPRQPVDDRDGLAAPALRLETELRGRTRGRRLALFPELARAVAVGG